MRSRMLCAALAGAAAMAWGAAHAVPAAFTYTGELWADNGLPYTGAITLGVQVYGAASGGEALWTRPDDTALVDAGVLTVELAGDELAALFGQHDGLWLAFTIDGEALEPRQQLTSVPYAAVAGDAQTVGGMPASAFMPAGGDVGASSLPTDGIGQISNGALNNAFQNVTWAWGGTATPIIDAPAPGAAALVVSSETGDSYLTALTVYTQHNLTFANELRLRLFPPPAAGVGPIELFSGVRTAGTYAESWTPGNTPALAALLGKKVEGEWTFEITDLDDNAAAGVQVGELQAFSIDYDVVRSDHMQMAGRLDVSGDLNVGGDAAIVGDVVASGVGDFKFIGWAGHCSSHNTTSGTATPYCLNSVRYDAAEGFLSVANNTITIERAGYYRVHWFAYQRNYASADMLGDLYVNDQLVSRSRFRHYTTSQHRVTPAITYTQHYVPGDTIQVRVTAGSSASSQYGAAAGPINSGLEIHYQGH